MEKEEFNNLKRDTYFYDTKSEEEWKILKSEGKYWNCICTKEGSEWRLDAKADFSEISAHRFTLGRHPSNLPQPSEQELFVNVYEQEGEFYTGDSAFDSAQKAYDSRDELSTYRYTAKLVRVEIQTPYVPKHNELCRFEKINTTTGKGIILECTALHLEDRVHAFVTLKDGANGGFYEDAEIKQFLPLT